VRLTSSKEFDEFENLLSKIVILSFTEKLKTGKRPEICVVGLRISVHHASK
jgi:hypothetical protein